MDRYREAMAIMNQLAFKVTKGVYPGLSRGFEQVGSNNKIAGNKGLGPNILVLFTGSNIGLSERLRELSKLKERGCTFEIAYSNSAVELLDINLINSQLQPERVYTEKDWPIYDEIISKAQLIVAPVITQNSAVKLALGIQDEFIPMILWRSLWLDKTVFMDMEGVLTHIGETSKKPFLQQMMRDYVDRLQKMGIRLIKTGNYIDEILKNFFRSSEKSYTLKETIEKTVLTERDIRERRNTKEIVVPMKAIITPLAYDAAKELGIKIIRKD
jgi:hypothetical protein